MNYGYVKSNLSPSDIIISAGGFPSEYMIKNLDPIRDQGQIPKCVSVSVTDMLNYKLRFRGQKIVRDSYFYDNRPDKSMYGMCPKDAMKLLKDGLSVSGVTYKAKSYTRIGSIEQAKYCIASFGPVMIAIPVSSGGTDFWNGNSFQGGHAVTLVGYNQQGFRLRNSWGLEYGNNGYSIFPYNCFSKVYESWSLIN